MRVTKRDNKTVEPYSLKEVRKCLVLSFNAAGLPVPETAPIEGAVTRRLHALSRGIVGVDDVLDAVEHVLMASGYPNVAKRFILYREEHNRLRAQRLSPDPLAISDYTHVGKYAKFRPEVGRREVYAETVRRVRNMHWSRFHGTQVPMWTDPVTGALVPEHLLTEDIAVAFAGVAEKRWLPSMRSMQFGGNAIEKQNARMYNCCFTHINRTDVFSKLFWLLLCGCGVGYSVQEQHVEMLPRIKNIDRRRVTHHVIEDSIEGWADAIEMLMWSYFVSGNWIEFSYHKIRSEGSPLRTSGGKAPGHLALREAVESIRLILNRAQGRQLRPLDCHDILCHLSIAVLSGGIRRSAMISLFSPSDTEMVYCKAKGNYDPSTGLNAQRQMANNSAVFLREQVREHEFRRIIRVAEENYGDPGFLFVDDLDYGCNPCFVGDTLLHTSKGLKRIEELVGIGPVDVVQADGTILPATRVEQTGRGRPVFKMTLDTGHSVTVTSNHEFPTFRGRLKLRDIKVGDKLFIQYEEGQWGEGGTYAEGLTLGLWQGEGTSHDKEAFICLWGEDQRWAEYIRDNINEACNTQYSWYESSNHLRLGSNRLMQFIGGDKSRVPQRVMRGSREMVRGYLEGIFFAGGSIMGNAEKSYSLRLNQSNRQLLEDVQVLLSNFGLRSKIHIRHRGETRRMPGGEYHCKPNYDLILNRNNMCLFIERVGLFGPKYERFMEWGITRSNRKLKNWARVVSIEEAGTADVYCLNQPKTHDLVANGIKAGNCGEIGLYPVLWEPCSYCEEGSWCSACSGTGSVKSWGFAFCNLTEINCAAFKTARDFFEAAKWASFIGTLQAAYTDFGYLGSVSRRIAERDALIGVSLTGVMDNPDIALDPDIQQEAARIVNETNAFYAGVIGLNVAARTTTIKPSGTASLELGCVGSGIHPHHAPRYFRRVYGNLNEPPVQEFMRVNPHMVEKKPDGDVALVFPVEAPSGAVCLKDLSALEQVEHAMSTYDNWVKPGTVRSEDSPGLTHNVSCTVTLMPGEKESVVDYIWENRHRIAAMSFAPGGLDKMYPFAPREAVVTEEDETYWNRLIGGYKRVDWTLFSEEEDNTVRQQAPACTAPGGCDG